MRATRPPSPAVPAADTRPAVPAPMITTLFVVFGLLKIGSAEARNLVPEELQYLEEPDVVSGKCPSA